MDHPSKEPDSGQRDREDPRFQATHAGTDETVEYRAGDAPTEPRADSASGPLAAGASAEATPPKHIVGEYIVLEPIGAGGGGHVYKAEHRRMERIVALKLLPKSSPAAVKRFHQEVKAAAKLIHPNIVTAFDAGEQDGVPYLVMEYVSGKSLAQVVEDNGPLQVDVACDLTVQAARGLAYAHSRKIIHRDIKPSNLMLDENGVVKILDMGLARQAAAAGGGSGEEADAPGELTRAGTVIGTVNYMSPEQTRDARSVDHRTDIYSLGCTLYYLLTGQSVYSGDIIAVLLAHTQQPIPSLRKFREDVPDDLEAVYRRMLAKQPEDRYPTAEALIADLEAFIERGFSRAASATPGLRPSREGAARETAGRRDRLVVLEAPSAKMVDSLSAVGIDLGTTRSLLAHIDKKTGHPVTASAEGEWSTPSVVVLDGSSVAIGTAALESARTKADGLADRINGDLGRNLYHRPLSGQHYPPEVLLGLIVNQLVENARRSIGDFQQAVIAVPASFDDVRRKAVEDAAYIAGVDVLDLINQPMAAAAAFAAGHKFFAADPPGRTRKIFVCDIGAGGFGASVIQAAQGTLSVLASGGELAWGGYEWDGLLASKVAKLYSDKHGLDPLQQPQAARRLWRACEDARRTLSEHHEATIDFEFEGNWSRVKLKRRQFESYTREILDGLRAAIVKTLETAETSWAEIDHVLLLGGMAKTPVIRRLLQKISGKTPETRFSENQAVAAGAALYAEARLAAKAGRPSPWSIEEINPHSIGTVATDTRTGEKRAAILIPRNKRLPATARLTLKTHKPGQDSLTIQIVQGESKSLKECTLIGKCVIDCLPPGLPAGTPFQVEFCCASSGRLAVFVEIPNTRRRVEQAIRRPARLSPAELERWRGWVETMSLCAGLEIAGD